MLNANLLPNGWYPIQANSGPVSIEDNRVVVDNDQEYFYFQRQYNSVYNILPATGGSVQADGSYRLIAQQGVSAQNWVLRQYGNRYSIVEEGTDPNLGWTDGGGAAGHQLYLSVLDPNNVQGAQLFTIPGNGIRGNVHNRK
ncbi:hypothetical protein V8B97DRAFT_1919792 [Scleroderma yunnanense]